MNEICWILAHFIRRIGEIHNLISANEVSVIRP